MISANEARNLTKQSEAFVDSILESFDGLIIEATKRGDRFMNFSHKDLNWGGRDYEVTAQPTVTAKLVMDKIRAAGYQVIVSTKGPESIGFGGAPDELYINYFLRVSW